MSFRLSESTIHPPVTHHDSSRCALTSLLRPLIPVLGLLLGTLAYSQNVVHIDATAPVQPPQPVEARLGVSKAPDGETLRVNSRYLVRNGKPWLPVMGEFQYSRVPERQWEDEILKMKAAGVEILSTYVIWIHHEEVEGQYDWSGQRNLRHFAELCAKHGMYVYPRIGPWVHAEARNGGFPDWVLKRSPVRVNNPIYLAEARSFYDQIGEQLKGLFWKDGGPVIGIQLENEYHGSGPGSGDAHIRALKQLALEAGLDVPLYTVTGWDGAAVPLDEVLPVYGGYVAAPWTRKPGKLPASEAFAFRYENRVAGSMGAMGAPGQNGAEAYRDTPFLTAEMGGGNQDTYYRRPVISADDVGALAPVMLGSGANLLGYYMFQGGRNPDGRLTTLQESQRTGYATDVPVKSYDFQAPLSEFGEERESFRRLKLIDYFLQDEGSLLAPMAVDFPAERPADASDIYVARVSARASGDHAFLFFNNYVRHSEMPARRGFQVRLRLPSGELAVPEKPITLPSGAYGIWPVNFKLSGHRLVYSTAELLMHVKHNREDDYFFFAIPGIVPEFAFPAAERVETTAALKRKAGRTQYLRFARNTAVQQFLLPAGKHQVRVILLSRKAAEGLWKVDGTDALVMTSAEYSSDEGRVYLYSDGDPNFLFRIFGNAKPAAAVPLQGTKDDGGFVKYSASLQKADLTLQSKFLHAASARTAEAKGGIPMAPEQSDFQHAAAWAIYLPTRWPKQISNVFLQLNYTGDVARLYAGNDLLDDNFWNGTPWKVGLAQWRERIQTKGLKLLVLPAPEDAAIGNTGVGSEAGWRRDDLVRATLIPQYQLGIKIRVAQ